jgi:hypothetical protein
MDPSHDICQMGRADVPPPPATTSHVTTEGAEHEWHSPTITAARIRSLAGWDVGQAVVEVDLDTGTETTPGTVKPVTLRPGAGFARRIRFTQGTA